MRTKTLLLSAVLGAVGIAAASAQVYSVNVVGYTTVTLKPGFNLIANQLNSTNNTLGALMPNVPPGLQFFKYVPGSGYSTYSFDEIDLVWTPNGNVTLSPGEGGFVKNPFSTNITVTFVGEVIQGTTTNSLVPGFQLISCTTPIAGTATTLGIPSAPGDQLFKYVNGAGYSTFNFDEIDLVWLPSDPTISVGEAVYVKKLAAANWVRTFTVQ